MNVVFAYILLISLAEALGSYVNAIGGAAVHGLLIVSILTHCALRPNAPYARVLPALMLAPLIRVLSLVMASPDVPQFYWHVLVGFAVLVSVGLAVTRLRISRSAMGLRVRYLALQGLIALSGLSFGLAGFVLLRPRPLFAGLDWTSLVINATALAVMTGIVEEVVFRGLVQAAARAVFGGPAAVLCSTLLFASMYLGSLSPGFFFVISLVGLYFGYCALKTGSLAGVVVAHILMNLGLLVIWPALLA